MQKASSLDSILSVKPGCATATRENTFPLLKNLTVDPLLLNFQGLAQSQRTLSGEGGMDRLHTLSPTALRQGFYSQAGVDPPMLYGTPGVLLLERALQ